MTCDHIKVKVNCKKILEKSDYIYIFFINWDDDDMVQICNLLVY